MKLKKKKSSDLSFILGMGGTAKGVGTLLGLGAMSFQNTKDTAPIGEVVKKDSLIEGTATVYFVTEDAVTRLIKELTQMRADMKKARKTKANTMEIVIDATDHNADGYSKQRGKAPRKRAKR